MTKRSIKYGPKARSVDSDSRVGGPVTDRMTDFHGVFTGGIGWDNLTVLQVNLCYKMAIGG